MEEHTWGEDMKAESKKRGEGVRSSSKTQGF